MVAKTERQSRTYGPPIVRLTFTVKIPRSGKRNRQGAKNAKLNTKKILIQPDRYRLDKKVFRSVLSVFAVQFTVKIPRSGKRNIQG